MRSRPSIGTGVDPSFIVPPAGSGLAVDAGHIYWANSGTDEEPGTIGRANLDGSGVDRKFITGAGRPLGVAVDAATSIGPTSAGRPRPVCDTIIRANLDGSGTTSFSIGPSTLAGGSRSPPSTSTGSHLFGCAIGRANLDGTGVEESFIPAGTPTRAVGRRREAHLLDQLPTNSGTIGRANLDGTGVERASSPATQLPARASPSTPRTSTGPTRPPARSGAPTSTARASIRASSPAQASRRARSP